MLKRMRENWGTYAALIILGVILSFLVAGEPIWMILSLPICLAFSFLGVGAGVITILLSKIYSEGEVGDPARCSMLIFVKYYRYLPHHIVILTLFICAAHVGALLPLVIGSFVTMFVKWQKIKYDPPQITFVFMLAQYTFMAFLACYFLNMMPESMNLIYIVYITAQLGILAVWKMQLPKFLKSV